jgi:hypothetical protein
MKLTDSQAFLAALDEHAVWDFARRPIDVVDLAEFWQANQRLGTLTEIIEHDIARKIRETVTRQRGFALSEEKARLGAESLAAATILCKRQQFKVPDDAFVAPEALVALVCLPPSWVPDESAALLSRPLFDGAAYGQVQFHHRRVAEYLAAQWLRRRMTEGCPITVLKELLFDTEGGQLTPRRSLIPIIAWLCAGNERWNKEVRDWVLRSMPEMHLEYGDPEVLSLDYRRALLQAWVESNRGRTRVGFCPRLSQCGVWPIFASPATCLK